jgi:ABC transporter with metal-binding/Fe-S-binding domain ATP-binding protein
MQGWDVVSLVTVIPDSKESWMFHFPAVKWTGLQAQAMRIPRTIIQTAGVKEVELDDLKCGLRRLIKSAGIDGIVSGAVASEYQRSRLDNLCEELGIRSFAPLWHKNQAQLVREQIDSGFEIIVTACGALGLTSNWLGRNLNHASLDELVRLGQKHGLSVAFEGGEAETFVLDAPMFNGKLQVIRSHVNWSGDSGYLDLEEVLLRQD